MPFGLNPIAQEISVQEFHRLRCALVKIFCEFNCDDLEEPLQLIETYFEEKIDEDKIGPFVWQLRCYLQTVSHFSKVYREYVKIAQDSQFIHSWMVEYLEKCLHMLELPYSKRG